MAIQFDGLSRLEYLKYILLVQEWNMLFQDLQEERQLRNWPVKKQITKKKQNTKGCTATIRLLLITARPARAEPIADRREGITSSTGSDAFP